MPVIRGKAALTWTDTDDQTTSRVLLLPEPLRELQPAHTQSVYAVDSLDFQTRQTFTIGEGVDELVGRLRYQDDHQGLLDLIKAGTKQRTITYYPDLRDADVNYACLLIAPLSPLALGLDTDRGVTFAEKEVTIRLRRTAKTPFTDAWKNTTLFQLRAGGRIEEATFSRAGVASYAALAGGGGFGTLTTAASGAARTSWFSTGSSLGPRTFPALVLEEQRTNFLKQSENFASTTWAKTSVVVTTGKADPRGGTAAQLIDDNSTVAQGFLRQVATHTGSSFLAVSLYVRMGTTAQAFGTELIIRSTNNATTYIRANVRFTSGRATATITNRGTLLPIVRWRDGWYRVAFRSTATLSTGNYAYHIYPAIGGGVAAKGNIYLFGMQAETV